MLKHDVSGPRYEPFDNLHEYIEGDIDCLQTALEMLRTSLSIGSPSDIRMWCRCLRTDLLAVQRVLRIVENMSDRAEVLMWVGVRSSNTPPSDFNFVYHVGPEYYRRDDETVFSAKVTRGSV